MLSRVPRWALEGALDSASEQQNDEDADSAQQEYRRIIERGRTHYQAKAKARDPQDEEEDSPSRLRQSLSHHQRLSLSAMAILREKVESLRRHQRKQDDRVLALAQEADEARRECQALRQQNGHLRAELEAHRRRVRETAER